MRASSLIGAALIVFANCGCMHVSSLPSPKPLAGSATPSSSSMRICVSPFENLSPKRVVRLPYDQNFKLIVEPPAGVYVADALSAELLRSRAFVIEKECTATFRAINVSGQVQKFEVQITDTMWTRTVVAPVEVVLQVHGCDTVQPPFLATYVGEVPPTKYGGTTTPDTIVEQLLPLSVRDLVKSILYDPNFMRAIRDAWQSCTEVPEEKPTSS